MYTCIYIILPLYTCQCFLRRCCDSNTGGEPGAGDRGKGKRSAGVDSCAVWGHSDPQWLLAAQQLSLGARHPGHPVQRCGVERERKDGRTGSTRKEEGSWRDVTSLKRSP